MNQRIAAVILAAGMSSRMGQQKLLLPLGGKPLLSYVLNLVHNQSWTDSVVIIGQPVEELTKLCQYYDLRSVYNANRQKGQATSIALAMQQLQGEFDGFVFFMGDQPLVSPALIEAILTQFDQASDNRSIIVPCHQGQRYSPVLFGSHWQADLAALTGDTGGKQIMRKNPEWVHELAWPDASPFYDADTWEEYQQMRRLVGK